MHRFLRVLAAKYCDILQVRVNYYVREVYGDPENFHDAWDAPFAVLALQGPTTLFVHPLVEKVFPTYLFELDLNLVIAPSR